ncbi:hypothetical protein O1Q79_00213 [Lonepinella sp. MS14434]|uniref:TRAP transporter small permease n=1 Tax=unclassified Lonepinella TaxID=2642006 RepID=UPI0036DE9030
MSANNLNYYAENINKKITIFTESVGAAILAIIVIINAVSVFFRYALNMPISWTEEFLRYAIVWSVYLVTGAVAYRGEEMVINLVDIFNSKLLNKCVLILSTLSYCVLAFIIFYYGVPLLLKNYHQLSPTMGIPMAIPYASVIVGYAILSIQSMCLLLTKFSYK